LSRQKAACHFCFWACLFFTAFFPTIKLMVYTDMTDAEYDALDEELTRSIPKLGPSGSDWLTHWELRLMGVSKLSTDYLLTKATATSRTPVQIIDELLRPLLFLEGGDARIHICRRLFLLPVWAAV
jgi:hypothetical protein